MGTLTTALMSVSRAKNAERGLMLTFFIQGFIGLSIIPRIPELLTQIHVGFVQWGLISGLSGLGGLIPLLFANRLIMRFGTRPIMQVTFLLMAACFASYGFIPSGGIYLSVALVLSFFGSILGLALNSQGVMFQDRVGRVVLGKMHATWSIGATLSSLISGLLAPYIPLHWYMVSVSVLCVIAMQVANRLLLAPHEDGHEDEKKKASKSSGGNPFKLPPMVWLLAAGLFASVFPEVAVMDWSAVFLKKELAQGAATMGLAYSAFSMAMIASRLSVSRITKRTPITNISRFSGFIGGIMMLTGVLGGVAVSKISPTAGLVVSVVFFGLAGLGIGPMVPTFFGAAGSVQGLPTPLVMARMTLFNSLSILGAKILMGGIAQGVGVIVAFVMPAALLTTGGLLAGILTRWSKAKAVEPETTEKVLEDAYPATAQLPIIVSE